VRRLGLLVFGVAFLALFVIVAIAEGIGHPSVPSGDVALVEDAPGDVGQVTQEKFDHALELTAIQAGEKKAPKPGSPKYDELKETALDAILESVWLQGLAAEEGVEVSDKEVAAERKKVEKESFGSKKEFEKFLKESGYTSADVDERVKLQVLSEQLQKKVGESVAAPSKGEIEDYYEAAKGTQFKQPASRDIRMVQNKDEKKVEAAKEQLEKDNSAASWKKVATKYSTDSLSKENGGERLGVTEGTLEEPLDADVFGAEEDQLIGPVKTKQGYTIFEVKSSTPESTQELKAVESQIESTLSQRNQQEYFGAYVAAFTSTWTDRTFCDSGFLTERCANFQPSGHPSAAPEACYEANPKGGLPEACPAPVFQLAPALPGSVTPLEPRGKPLPQRPRPAGPEEEAAEALPEGIPAPTP
jgi:parvulin-like peptidyl-prolyl isomerase